MAIEETQPRRAWVCIRHRFYAYHNTQVIHIDKHKEAFLLRLDCLYVATHLYSIQCLDCILSEFQWLDCVRLEVI